MHSFHYNISEMSTQGIRFILTYAQCNETNKEALLELLKDKLKEKLIHAIVCKENHHETDGEHYHAYIKLDTRRRIKADDFNLELDDLKLEENITIDSDTIE